MAAVLYGPPTQAQQTETTTGIDESRVVIPRPKILRVPQADETNQTDTSQTDADASRSVSVQQDADTTQPSAGTGIETRPLEPIVGSSTGGGLVPIQDVSLDPNVGVAQPLPFPIEQTSRQRVRVVSPGSGANRNGSQQDETSDTETAAATTEGQTGPRWKRKRDRRFKLAPKSTDVLDASRTFAVPISPIKTELKQGARLRQLDKMTGQTVTYDLGVGESRRVDRLLVTLNACRASGDNTSHGAMAFLKIWDTRNIGGDPNFTGWMFAESPALSALDHPRYDLWVINCTISDAEVSTVSE